MEFRKVFDTIPDQFDKYRPRYCTELFASLIEYADIGPEKTVITYSNIVLVTVIL